MRKQIMRLLNSKLGKAGARTLEMKSTSPRKSYSSRRLRAEMLLKRVFDAVRYSNVNDKFEATRQELEDKIPLRQELERQKDELIKMSN
jgi:hypothetical protein